MGDLLSYSKRVILLLLVLQVSYGVLGNFFSQIGHEVKKPRGASGITPFLLLEKLSYIMKLMSPPKNPCLDRFPSFFLLGPCHLILSKFSSKSCLSIAMGTRRNFFAEKTNRKNVATLRTRSRKTVSCRKLIFYLKKALPMLRKMPKTALF